MRRILIALAGVGMLAMLGCPRGSEAPAPCVEGVRSTCPAATCPQGGAEECPLVPVCPPAAAVPAAAVQTGDGSPDNPVTVPYASQAVAVDGNPADWAGIGPVPAPFSKKDASSLKLAWREEGLYGLATVEDPSVSTSPNRPWRADSVELFIESDFARAANMTASAMQLVISPADGESGRCSVWGKEGDNVTCVSAKVSGGYVVEFLIPADTLKPAGLAAGRKMGFNFAINNEGTAVEQFFVDKGADRNYRTPSTWGAIVLTK